MKKSLLGSVIVVTVLLVFTFTAAIAAYTGPGSRTLQTGSDWQRKYCTYSYRNTDTGPAGPFFGRYVTPSSSCPTAGNKSEGWQTGGGGYAWHCTHWTDLFSRITWDNGPANRCYNIDSYWYVDYGTGYARDFTYQSEIQSCTSGQTACTAIPAYTTYDAATVSGTPTCSLDGDYGWCRGGAVLALSSSETIPTYSITKIETATQTLCTSGSCSYPMPEGPNSLTYWAVSSFGDTSAQSTSSMNVDTVPPTANLSVAGTQVDGWYNGSVTMTTTGTDATSGVASRGVEIDGAVAQASPFTFTGEGTFSAIGLVTDVAGWETRTPAQTVKRDVTAPVPATNTSEPISPSGWYNAPLFVSSAATDNASGVDRTEYDLTSGIGTTSSGNLPVLIDFDGQNDLSLITYDVAGNSVAHNLTVKLDTVPPTSSISFVGPIQNGWYNGSLTITANGTDATSGVASREVEVDGGIRRASPLVFTDEGTFTVASVVTDNAGSENKSEEVTISRDVTDPVVTIHASGTPAASGWYRNPVTISATGTDNASGYDRTEYTLTNGAGVVSTGVLPVTLNVDGTNSLSFISYDVAGNSVSSSASYDVDITDPTATLIAAGSPPVITLSGILSDEGSGLASSGLSLDGGVTWLSAPIGAGGAWSYTWNTSILPDGVNALQLRASDNAGRSTLTNLSFIVANTPAEVYLADPWTLPASGALEVVEGGIEYHTVTVTICDPKGRASCIVRNYAPSEVPGIIEWDGWFGSYEAPAGAYDVTVKVFDNIDRVVVAESAIIVPEVRSPFMSFVIEPVSTATPIPDNEGGLIRFFGFVKFYDGSKLNIDGKSFSVTSESIINDGNGEIKTGVLVSGTAMSLTNRVVAVKTLSAQLAEGDGLITFQGVIDYWSDSDDSGDSWLIINDLAYHLTPETEIHGEASEGSYVVGIMENGLVVSVWPSLPGSENSLATFKGTISEIIGSVDQLPYTIAVSGLNYQVNDQTMVSGNVVTVGSFVTGSTMGADRIVLAMEVTDKKPGLWSLALDFFTSKKGGFLVLAALGFSLLSVGGLILLKFFKTKKEKEKTVSEAVEKLSN